ncbi:MAG: SDR family oxidoreductase [Cytophagaceae bacterium]|nr:SDR family oxidoreductase [Cytophagaceae bacterium]
MNGKTALITGASSGFGREFAKLFAQDGYNLVLVARQQEVLQQLSDELTQAHGINATVLAKDLAQPDAADQIYLECQQQGIQVDVLVNDAGLSEYGKFVESDLRKELDTIQVNVTSLVYLTKLFLRDMVARNEGKILQLGSTLSLIPTPLMAVYGATKAFVLSFTEALQNELNDTNVTLTILMPGAADTDFFNKAGAEDTKVYQDTKLSKPEDVARDGYEGLMSGVPRVVSGFKNKVQAVGAGMLPGSLMAAAMRDLMEPYDPDAERKKKITQYTIAGVVAAGVLTWLALGRNRRSDWN